MIPCELCGKPFPLATLHRHEVLSMHATHALQYRTYSLCVCVGGVLTEELGTTQDILISKTYLES